MQNCKMPSSRISLASSSASLSPGASADQRRSASAPEARPASPSRLRRKFSGGDALLRQATDHYIGVGLAQFQALEIDRRIDRLGDQRLSQPARLNRAQHETRSAWQHALPALPSVAATSIITSTSPGSPAGTFGEQIDLGSANQRVHQPLANARQIGTCATVVSCRVRQSTGVRSIRPRTSALRASRCGTINQNDSRFIS